MKDIPEIKKKRLEKKIADFFVSYGTRWVYDEKEGYLAFFDNTDDPWCEIYFCEDEIRIKQWSMREPYYEMKYDGITINKRKGYVSFTVPTNDYSRMGVTEVRVTGKEGAVLEPVVFYHEIKREYKIFTGVPARIQMEEVQKNEKEYLKWACSYEENKWYTEEEEE